MLDAKYELAWFGQHQYKDLYPVRPGLDARGGVIESGGGGLILRGCDHRLCYLGFVIALNKLVALLEGWDASVGPSGLDRAVLRVCALEVVIVDGRVDVALATQPLECFPHLKTCVNRDCSGSQEPISNKGTTDTARP